MSRHRKARAGHHPRASKTARLDNDRGVIKQGSRRGITKLADVPTRRRGRRGGPGMSNVGRRGIWKTMSHLENSEEVPKE